MGLDDLHEQINARGFGRRSTARGAELSDAGFARHAAAIGLSNPRRDLWVPAGAELSHDQRLDAVLDTWGDNILVTASSGLHLEGILAKAPADVELLVPAGRHLRDWPGTCVHRSITFDQVRAHHVAGHPVAAVPRCFADHAAHVSSNELCRDISAALRLHRCTLSAIATEWGLRKRYPGRGRLGHAIARLSEEVTHSSDERLARRLLRSEGLSFHHEPLRIDDEHGRPIAEIDIAFPDLLLGIEIDGPHHLLPHVAAADRQRDRLLQRVAGWRIERFFWFEVEERQAWFVSQVSRFLAECGAPSA